MAAVDEDRRQIRCDDHLAVDGGMACGLEQANVGHLLIEQRLGDGVCRSPNIARGKRVRGDSGDCDEIRQPLLVRGNIRAHGGDGITSLHFSRLSS